ncbi:hypothetical protein CEXT_510231 [Caerostris extrusa]|uniref:Uncharacterized protein n=1 Tax=Caerostris extrusa TaxID=172846 RepID=A0AAV4QSX1_CAEEX|nr:hypothetical protein CEXT_510231 [Caerostris extrusa]
MQKHELYLEYSNSFYKKGQSGSILQNHLVTVSSGIASLLEEQTTFSSLHLETAQETDNRDMLSVASILSLRVLNLISIPIHEQACLLNDSSHIMDQAHQHLKSFGPGIVITCK